MFREPRAGRSDQNDRSNGRPCPDPDQDRQFSKRNDHKQEPKPQEHVFLAISSAVFRLRASPQHNGVSGWQNVNDTIPDSFVCPNHSRAG